MSSTHTPSSQEPRKAVGALELGDHMCLVYDNDDERRAIMAAYVRDGVRANQKVIYISDGVTAADLLDWLLGEHKDVPEHAAGGRAEVDLRAAMEAGDFVVRTAEETFLASGRFDPHESVELMATEIDLALVQGYEGVRVAGEARFSLRSWPGTERFGDFERMLDEVMMDGDVKAMAICQFDRRWFDPDRLAEVVANHAGGRVRADDYYDDGTLRITPIFGPPGAELAGDIDASTRTAMVDALAAVAGRSHLICLDVSGVRRCDEEGLRTLVGTGRTSGGKSRQLLLRGASERLLAMMRDAGLDREPGVSIEEAVR
jgi:ABC-type transporter Mla MlaB component